MLGMETTNARPHPTRLFATASPTSQPATRNVYSTAMPHTQLEPCLTLSWKPWLHMNMLNLVGADGQSR